MEMTVNFVNQNGCGWGLLSVELNEVRSDFIISDCLVLIVWSREWSGSWRLF